MRGREWGASQVGQVRKKLARRMQMIRGKRSSKAIPINTSDTQESNMFHWTWSQCSSSYIPFIFSLAIYFRFYTKKIYAPFCGATTTAPNEAKMPNENYANTSKKKNIQVRFGFLVFCRPLELSKWWNMHFCVCVSGVPLPMRVILYYVFILARRWQASIYFHSIC